MSINDGKVDFNHFFDVSTELLCVTDKALKILYTNKEWKHVLGYTVDEILGVQWLSYISPDDLENVQKSINSLGDKDHIIEFVGKYKSVIGSYKSLQWRVTRNEEYVYFAAKDMTQFVEHEKLIDDKTQRFMKLFNNNPALMAVSSTKNRKYVDVNTTFCQKIGYQRDEIIGKTSLELDLIVDEEKFIDIISRFNTEGKISNIEFDIRCKDGHILTGIVSGEVIESDSEKFFLTVMTDISELKQAHTNTKNNERQLRHLLENMVDAIWIVDQEGNILDANKRACQDSGFSKAELQSKTVKDIEPSLQKDLGNMIKQLFEDEVLRFRIKHVGQKGNDYELDVTASTMQFNETKLIVAVTRNITKQQTYEKLLTLAKEAAENASSAKSQFLANMSHELRTPLNGLIGLTELLEMTSLDDEQNELLTMVRISVDRLAEIINGILRLTQIGSGEYIFDKKAFDLRDLIEGIVEEYSVRAREKENKLEVIIDKEIPILIMGIPEKIRQVMCCLLSNSIKFTSQGDISISVIPIAEPDDNKLHLSFEVKDTGIGISPNTVSRIFELFEQGDNSSTKEYGGVGLGLTISREIVKLLGGNITVMSEVNQGSSFCFDAYFELD